MIYAERLLTRLPRSFIQTVSNRCLTKTAQYPTAQGKHYRLWALPGDLVYRKDILAKQHTVKWHPGLNAGIDNDRSIYALVDGIVVITEDEFNPDWSHPIVKEIYMKEDGQKRAPVYIRYINVIPKRQISEFKLIDMV